MFRYLIRRSLLIIPTLLSVSIIVFLLIRFIPGDIVDNAIMRIILRGGALTAEEQAVLEACLLASASGISDEDLSPAASACFAKRLSAEVLQMVGSGARSLTPEEEGVLVDCLVTTALDTTPSASTFEGCLQERLGEGLALLVASRSVPLNDVETQALNAYLLVSALTVMSRQLRSGQWPVWRNVWERT